MCLVKSISEVRQVADYQNDSTSLLEGLEMARWDEICKHQSCPRLLNQTSIPCCVRTSRVHTKHFYSKSCLWVLKSNVQYFGHCCPNRITTCVVATACETSLPRIEFGRHALSYYQTMYFCQG